MDNGIDVSINTSSIPPTLLPPPDVLLLGFQGRVPPAVFTIAAWGDLLMSAGHMVLVHTRIQQAKEELRDTKLPDRGRLDAAIIVGTAERSLTQLIAKIDTWLEGQPMPDQDEDILDSAQPFMFSLGEVISKMAALVAKLGDEFIYVSGFTNETSDDIHWVELTGRIPATLRI